jgi:hypothetical protein
MRGLQAAMSQSLNRLSYGTVGLVVNISALKGVFISIATQVQHFLALVEI